MSNYQTFYVSVIGSGHTGTGKPCQDSSFCFSDPAIGLDVAVVADGHGGSTYVRSDRGSALACEVALEKVREFVAQDQRALFMNRCGAVTTQPSARHERFRIHNDGQSLSSTSSNPTADNEEPDDECSRQDRDYDRQVAGIEDVEQAMRHLFGSIYTEWLRRIREDVKRNPMTSAELMLLGRHDIVKAYGSTLMVFVNMPDYWFAFHLGDGKLLMMVDDFEWQEPVPWDYKCFLNITTSLCQNNPIEDFRYAFSGQGEHPVAVFMGSDGLDDTWQTMDNLQNAYAKILRLMYEDGIKPTVADLRDTILPDWSARGSHDDMSVAGLVDIAHKDDIQAILDKRATLRATERDIVEIQQKQKHATGRLAALREEMMTLVKESMESYERLKDLIEKAGRDKDEFKAALERFGALLQAEHLQKNREAAAPASADPEPLPSPAPEPLPSDAPEPLPSDAPGPPADGPDAETGAASPPFNPQNES